MEINYDLIHHRFYNGFDALFDDVMNSLCNHYEIAGDISPEQRKRLDSIIEDFSADATDLAVELFNQNYKESEGQSRINRIKAIKASHDKAEQMKKDAENAEREQLMAEVRAMGNEIREVIEIGNALHDNGFLEYNGFTPEDKRLKKYGYEHSMIANGVYHHVGFIRKDGRVSYLGIINGGACGAYDFITNGDETFSEHEDTKNHTVPRKGDLTHFIMEFPKFKKALYAWIDNNMN